MSDGRRLGLLAAAGMVFLATARPALAEEAKIDCENLSGATFEINECAGRELEAADAALNAAYKSALAAVPRMAIEKPYDARSWEEALRKSQRAWVAYRDAECKGHAPMFWGGGTGTTAEVLGCMTALTQARTKELSDRYEAAETAPP